MSKYPPFSGFCHATQVWHRPGTRKNWVRGARRCLLAACLLAGMAGAASGDHPADAIEVFHCPFDQTWDVNYDEWPDRWVRRSGPDYPHYVNMQIRDTDDPQSARGRCLEIELDGASPPVPTPPIRVMSQYSYLLATRLKVS